jgi:hypothetical protein
VDRCGGGLVNLSTIAAPQLPPLAYAHNNNVDVAGIAFRPIAGFGWVKPHANTGLWTAPVTRTNNDGTPADSEWLEWCRSEWDTAGYTHLTEIGPFADARVLLIDCLADLVAVVNTFPASGEFSTGLNDRYPDWVALAEASWDAVFLTNRGQWATRMPPRGPNLYGWDVPSVLWLRPAYSVGRTVELDAASVEVSS